MKSRSSRSSSSSPKRNNDGYHRYMKPGALAKLADTKRSYIHNLVLKRSVPHRVNSSLTQSSIQAQPHITVLNEMPSFLHKFYGPAYIGRMKIGAARSMAIFSLGGSGSAMEPGAGNNSRPLNTVLNNDARAAH